MAFNKKDGVKFTMPGMQMVEQVNHLYDAV
jgi:hypothetical protein